MSNNITTAQTVLLLAALTNTVHSAEIGTAPGLARLTHSNALYRVMSGIDSFSDPATVRACVNGQMMSDLKLSYGDGGIGYLRWAGAFGLTALTNRETTNFVDGVAAIYAGQSAGMLQSDDLCNMPNPTWINQWGFRYLTWPNGGVMHVQHTNPFVNESFSINTFSASTNVVYTNFPSQNSTNNAIIFFGDTATNIILQGELINTNGGVVDYHWGWGGTTPAQWLETDINYFGVLSNFFVSINPDLSLIAGRHWVFGSTATLPQLQTILNYVQPTSNTVVALQSDFPRVSDPNNAGTIRDNNFLKSAIATSSNNVYYIDLFTGYTNYNALVNSGVHNPLDGLHPTLAGAVMFARVALRQLGFDTPAEPIWPSVDIPVTNNGVAQFQAIRNGLFAGYYNQFNIAANPTIWLDPVINMSLSGTNVLSWGSKGSVSVLFGSPTGISIMENAVNGQRIVHFQGPQPTPPRLGAPGANRDWLVDVVNHTDSTIFVVSKQTAVGGTITGTRIFGAFDGGSSFYLNDLSGFGGNSASFQLGTDTVSFVGNISALRCWRFARAGSTMSIATNGVVAVTAGGKASSLNVLTGTLGIGDNYMDAQIAEIIIYNRALSASEIAGTENYLSSKYALGF
ncbi:MAG: hypothetical protein JWR19_3527 [Pedosphaera sp.]|nr:hypothetical protein [Pedosphaera sp.]